MIAASLPNNSTAGLLLFENVWATQFKEDLLEMNAEVIDLGADSPGKYPEGRERLGKKR